MKVTKRQLRKIIKEERAKIQEQYELTWTPEEKAVIDAIVNLEDALKNMGQGNPDLTDYYVSLLRSLKNFAGVDPKGLARLA
tara:strand:- start:3289 stop:3534 length:246 start_codon:yes stop_codon:yes gene_type:complete